MRDSRLRHQACDHRVPREQPVVHVRHAGILGGPPDDLAVEVRRRLHIRRHQFVPYEVSAIVAHGVASLASEPRGPEHSTSGHGEVVDRRETAPRSAETRHPEQPRADQPSIAARPKVVYIAPRPRRHPWRQRGRRPCQRGRPYQKNQGVVRWAPATSSRRRSARRWARGPPEQSVARARSPQSSTAARSRRWRSTCPAATWRSRSTPAVSSPPSPRSRSTVRRSARCRATSSCIRCRPADARRFPAHPAGLEDQGRSAGAFHQRRRRPRHQARRRAQRRSPPGRTALPGGRHPRRDRRRSHRLRHQRLAAHLGDPLPEGVRADDRPRLHRRHDRGAGRRQGRAPRGGHAATRPRAGDAGRSGDAEAAAAENAEGGKRGKK